MVPAGHSAQDCAEKEDCLRPGVHKPYSAETEGLGVFGGVGSFGVGCRALEFRMAWG